MDMQSLQMDPTPQILLTLGCILLLGLATDVLGQRTFLPKVILMLLFGMLIGPEMLDLIPVVVVDRHPAGPATRWWSLEMDPGF